MHSKIKHRIAEPVKTFQFGVKPRHSPQKKKKKKLTTVDYRLQSLIFSQNCVNIKSCELLQVHHELVLNVMVHSRSE